MVLFLYGVVLDLTGLRRFKEHVAGQLAALKNCKTIFANDESFAVAA